MSHYYNEIDPYPAQWLRNLMAAGHIPAGDVDERSITDVQPDDLQGYVQCHFFAGIGGWPLAARIAGWSDDCELWTGSAPCQPFSVAGQGKGQSDDRHLWPHLARLICARRPAVFMGEQVAAAVGKDWLDGVFADLESVGYACGAAIIPACAVNAPHRRDRLWFVAHATSERRGQIGLSASWDRSPDSNGSRDWSCNASAPRSCASVVADAGSERRQQIAGRSHEDEGAHERRAEELHHFVAGYGESYWHDASVILGHDGKVRRVEPNIHLLANGVPNRVGRLRAYGNAIVPQVAAEVIAAYMECRP